MAEVWGETVFSIFRTVLYMQTVLGQISSVLVVIILLCLVSTMRYDISFVLCTAPYKQRTPGDQQVHFACSYKNTCNTSMKHIP